VCFGARGRAFECQFYSFQIHKGGGGLNNRTAVEKVHQRWGTPATLPSEDTAQITLPQHTGHCAEFELQLYEYVPYDMTACSPCRIQAQKLITRAKMETRTKATGVECADDGKGLYRVSGVYLFEACGARQTEALSVNFEADVALQ